ncbi:MAG: Pectinesterase, partial [Phycisphaerales bacterium]|nr:Pectinesterase [Phycisphaerales bacterium]
MSITMTVQTLAITALLFCFTGCAAVGEKTPTTERAAALTSPVRIVLVGDSTVTDRVGWGGGFAELAGPGVKVINCSAGGRSSKSFRDEGKWEPALKEGGDYMLIQFGHNDQPGKGPERETDAKTTFKANMVRYANEARAAGF